jgi:hypothetical protein
VARRGPGATPDLVRRQRADVSRLRRELLGRASAGAYLRDLSRQLRGPFEPASEHDLLEACATADLIYLAEFHALAACQRFAAAVLGRLAQSGRPVAVAVEFVYTRQQHVLDLRQDGRIDDNAFLRRIHYREDWGYPWEGYRDLLDRARDAGSRVFGIDASPRAGARGLRRRDEHAARRIDAILSDRPGTRLLVLYGETHLSRNHLPRRVRARLARRGAAATELTVFQDPDVVYWELASSAAAVPPCVRVDPTTWAVFHGSPLEKYEAYRQVLERWREDVPPDEEVDLTPAVHHLIDSLLRWLELRPSRCRVRHRAGWVDEMQDAYPEVYGGPDAAALLPEILAEHRRTADEIREAERTLATRGAVYDSRANVLFLTRYLPGPAAGEAARFLRAALSGKLHDPPEGSWPDPAARAYGAAYNEALAFLGARLVDPSGDVLTSADRSALALAAAPVDPPGLDADRRAEWLEAHRRVERSQDATPGDAILAPLRADRSLRRALAREVGHRLGRVLFDEVRAGRLGARALRRLFSRRLAASDAAACVLGLLRSRRSE